MKQIFSILILFAFLPGCSTNSSLSKDLESKNFIFDIVIARSSASNPADFEQYKLIKNTIFQECGNIKKGQFISKTQELATITADQRSSLLFNANNLLSVISENGNKFQAPSTKFRFFDPGVITISFSIDNSETSINTSVDSISEPSTLQEKATLKFVEEIRKLSLTKCGNQNFYGIKG
ncbi:MAG: hypothetical protein SGJ02_13455 [bacterium]|nr:hypothetical protein [bacterium]